MYDSSSFSKKPLIEAEIPGVSGCAVLARALTRNFEKVYPLRDGHEGWNAASSPLEFTSDNKVFSLCFSINVFIGSLAAADQYNLSVCFGEIIADG